MNTHDNLLSPTVMSFRGELATATGQVDIGVGSDAAAATGMSSADLGASVASVIDELTDGGANKMRLVGVPLYAKRRGSLVDVGTRADFVAAGWAAICDILDAIEELPQ